MILIAYFEQLSQTKLLSQQRGMYSHFQFRLLYYPTQFSFFIVALSMKGGMLSYAVLIATFVVCLLKNKYVLDISYSRRFCYCGPHRRGKQSVCWDCSYSVQQTNQISEKWRTVVRYLFLVLLSYFMIMWDSHFSLRTLMNRFFTLSVILLLILASRMWF